MATQSKGITVDDAFLKAFINRGGQVETPTGTPVDAGNVDAFLKQESQAFKEAATTKEEKKEAKATEAKVDSATQKDKAAKLHEKAEQRAADLASAEAKARKAKEEAERRDQQRQLQVAQQGTSIAKKAVDQALVPAKSVADRVAAARTTGGIGLLVVILLILLFTVVQVNATGDTRMKQLWYMLNGRATLQGRQTITAPVESQQTFEQEFATLGVATEKLVGDAGLALANGVGNAATGGLLGGVESIFNGFRGLP